MRTAFPCLVATVLVLALVPAVRAKGPVSMKLALVRAQCEGPPPGPCAPEFAFTSGSALVRSFKQPAPTCPKTGDPAENKAGEVTLTGLTRSGAPFSGRLVGQVDFKTTFASDPNGTCVLAEVQVPPSTALQGTIDCKAGKCRGTLFQIACLPKPCADTLVISELSALVVKDDAGRALATPGLTVLPARADAP